MATSATYGFWDWSVDTASYGDATVTLNAGDDVTVLVSAFVYSVGAGTYTVPSIGPCYRLQGSPTINLPPPRGLTAADSVAEQFNQRAFQSTFTFKNLAAGTYQFSLCAAKWGGFGEDFQVTAPKVTLFVHNAG